MTSFSLIGHFLLSDQLYHNCVSNVCVVHEVDNCSDHDPVLLHLDIHVNRVSYTKRQYTAHSSCARALDIHVDSYKCVLQYMLKNISILYSALQRQDVFCKDNEHITSLDLYAAQLTEACSKSAEATIPLTRPCGESGHIPGWSEFVAPLRNQSIFGITFGQSLVNIMTLWLQTLCERPVHAIMLLLDRFAEMRQK